MVHIDFREVFKEIKEQYREYINSPKIFGSIAQNNPSIIIKKDNDIIISNYIPKYSWLNLK